MYGVLLKIQLLLWLNLICTCRLFTVANLKWIELIGYWSWATPTCSSITKCNNGKRRKNKKVKYSQICLNQEESDQDVFEIIPKSVTSALSFPCFSWHKSKHIDLTDPPWWSLNVEQERALWSIPGNGQFWRASTHRSSALTLWRGHTAEVRGHTACQSAALTPSLRSGAGGGNLNYRCTAVCHRYKPRAAVTKNLVSECTIRVATLCRSLTKLIRKVKGKCLSDHTSCWEKYSPLLRTIDCQ